MERITIMTVPLDAATLEDARRRGTLDADAGAPFRALLAGLGAAAEDRPVRVYVCSDDADVDLRNLFAWALARTLVQHLPSTLLIDCDFVRPGLGGIVPHHDALGFLDLLLYGSSVGAVAQEGPGGVSVVGAGSFGVGKRMPFVREAFDDAARRLGHHSRCMLFVGPADGDEGDVHPLAAAVDVVVRVSPVPAHDGRPSAADERLARAGSADVVSARLVGAPTASTGAASGPGAPRDGADAPGADGATDSVRRPEASQPAPPSDVEGVAEPAPDAADRAATPPLDAHVPPSEPVFEPLGEGEGARGDAGAGAARDAGPQAPPAAAPAGGGAGAGTDDPAGEGDAPVDETLEIPGDVLAEVEDDGAYSATVPRVIVALVALFVVAFVGWWFAAQRGHGTWPWAGSPGTASRRAGAPASSGAAPGVAGAPAESGGGAASTEVGAGAPSPAGAGGGPGEAVARADDGGKTSAERSAPGRRPPTGMSTG